MSTILKKKVNVYPRGPITNVNPPIRVPVRNVLLPIADIRRCVLAGAKVEEILPDKTVVKLNLHNYDQDNGGVITSVEQPDVAPKKPLAPKTPAKKQLTKEEMDKLKEKFNSPDNPLKEIISRTADEADEANKKKAAEPVPPVEEDPKKETEEETNTPQKYLTRRQLRKLREEQEAAAAKKATEEQPVIDTTITNDNTSTEATPLADALKAINAGEEVIVKDVAKL